MLISTIAPAVAIFGTYIPGGTATVTLFTKKGVLVPDPCHGGRLVHADVETVVNVSTRVASADIESIPTSRIDLNVVLRKGMPTTEMRNESRDGWFDSSKTFEGFDVINSIDVLTSGSPTYGNHVYGAVINATKNAKSELFGGGSAIINPNSFAIDNAWTDLKLSCQYRTIWADTTIYNSVKLEGHQQPRLDLLGKTSFLAGTYLHAEEPKVEHFRDTGGWGSSGYNYMEWLGGIEFTEEYAEKLGTTGLPLPRFSITSRIGEKPNVTPPPDRQESTTSRLPAPPLGSFINPKESFTTSSTQYVQDVGLSLGAEYVTGLVGKSGLSMPQLYGMVQGAAAQGSNMNVLRFPGDPEGLGEPQCGSSINFPPGTCWIPDRSGYQTMTNITPLRYQFEPENGLSVDGRTLFVEMRTHCLNMNLKEPADGIRYYPYSSPDPLIGALAQIAGNSRIRGPWDQARTWQYTGKASMDEINKRMMPGVGPGQYVNNLWDIVSRGGYGESELKDKKIFDPKLLLAAGARDDAFLWFATHIANNFGPDVRGWFEKRPQELRDLMAPSAQEIDRKHVQRLFKSILSSSDADARMGAISFLNRLQSPAASLKDQVGDLRMSLYTGDAGEKAAALQVCESYQTRRPIDALRYLAAEGPTEAIRSKAAALLAATEGRAKRR